MICLPLYLVTTIYTAQQPTSKVFGRVVLPFAISTGTFGDVTFPALREADHMPDLPCTAQLMLSWGWFSLGEKDPEWGV